MRLALVVRPDHATKPGGDIVQATAYADWLRTRGHEVVLGPIGPETLRCDLAFIFNLDLISEWVRHGQELAAHGCPYIAVPVHHPWEWLGRFEQVGRTGRLRTANRVLRSPAARDRARDIARAGLLERARWHARHPRSLIASAGAVLSAAAGVVYLADGERRHIERDYGVAPAGTVVRNGVRPAPAVPATDRPVDVVVVGRIEERKNQLRVARALAGTPLSVVFAGHVSAANEGYARRLLDVVEPSPNLSFVGQLAASDMAALLARSKVSASASWVEVACLVDIEAYVAGAGVVASSRGFSNEYGIEGLLELGPESPLEEIVDVCTSAVSRWAEPSAAERQRRLIDHAWETTLEPLEDLVQGCAG